MAQTFMATINTSLLLGKRLLTITPDFVDYKGANFSKFEIAEIRYGLQPIHGYRFTIGRLYCVDVKSLTGKIVKIRFSVLYGIGKRKADSIYTSILNALFENFVNEILGIYIIKFEREQEVNLLSIRLTNNGVILQDKAELIPWEDIGIRNYWSYCSIVVNSNPSVYKTFTYSTDWNAIVLYSILKYILKSKGLWKTQ